VTLQNAKDQVEVIKMLGGGEEAHMLQDELYEGILREIAQGDLPEGVAVALARYAVQVADMDFSRWYA
jgi:hypothetical protein